MKRKLLLVVLILAFVWGYVIEGAVFAYSNHGYPYNRNTGCREVCYEDIYHFCQNNCTSYAAYMLNLYNVSFSNSYRNKTWSHGKYWNDRAIEIGIHVDNYPIPGDIAYWEQIYEGDPYGHVAWVEKVYFDSQNNPIEIDVTEYNFDECQFSHRKISVDNPTGYIHILAYEEGVIAISKQNETFLI